MPRFSHILLLVLMNMELPVFGQKDFPLEQVMVSFKRPSVLGSDSLKKVLHTVDTLDEMIPWLMLQGRWEDCQRYIEHMEMQLELLRQSMGYLAQHMAYQKKVDELGVKLSDYRLQLFRQAMRPSSVILSPAVIQLSSFQSEKTEQLSARIRQLESDTVRLYQNLQLVQAEKDSLSRENLLLKHKLRQASEPLVLGISLGIQLGSVRLNRQLHKD